ncbi:DUF3822 family protein [Poritiphilus flavus]|uniref:DUF3822 family protein n=1 Tax=Poritiphilus flavus TaxID=2697053 RepID=A0A6L9EBJ8_9FLAO|nr:DUF3822 family protein [Poritiphilus flavus]NAS12100.1 DUF3822 family protein [Poritiphilus flavus]
MTKKEINSKTDLSEESYHKLSIQVSLNGLSFCILDTIANTIASSNRLSFGKELSPYEVQKELKDFLRENRVSDYNFSEVVAIHRNNLFSLVPKSLFDKDELANYLKFNAKILANDHLEYDEIEGFDMVNVYVPFVNINNYIYDLYGEFDFMHNGTVMVQSLLNTHKNGKDPVAYVHIAEQQMDLAVLTNKSLLFYNSFNFKTKEDFMYYLLFTLEQLKLDTQNVKVRLFGAVEEGDEIYSLCYEYIQHLAIFIPSNPALPLAQAEETIDFTVLNAL